MGNRVRVKMCGMTRPEDIAHAIDLGVDALGFIFYDKSARCITIDKALALLKNIPAFVDTVAVMVDPEPGFVEQIVNELPISILQFHGNESSQFCGQFGKPFIKAIQPESSGHIQKMAKEFNEAKAILLDTPSEKNRGGTGTTFDWTMIPKQLAKPCILAGGLNEANVLQAIKVCTPYAVDLCSGIEVSPGVKDHLKMSRFIKVLWGKE